jgi:hypothetical protein
MWKFAAALATRQYEVKSMQYQEESPIFADDFFANSDYVY